MNFYVLRELKTKQNKKKPITFFKKIINLNYKKVYWSYWKGICNCEENAWWIETVICSVMSYVAFFITG